MHPSTTAHEAAIHAARLRVELSQSRREQHEYLKNVELARVLDKRAERKRKSQQEDETEEPRVDERTVERAQRKKKKRKEDHQLVHPDAGQLENVLGSIF